MLVENKSWKQKSSFFILIRYKCTVFYVLVFNFMKLKEVSILGFSVVLMVKNPSVNAGDIGSIMAREHLLEEALASHSSILAWKSPWIEKPDELQSIGLHKVGHNWSDLACTNALWHKGMMKYLILVSKMSSSFILSLSSLIIKKKKMF